MRFVLLMLCGCASAPAEATSQVVALATPGSVAPEPEEPVVAPAPAPVPAPCRREDLAGIGYGMCVTLSELSEPAEVAQASKHFEATSALIDALCYSEASAEYLVGASVLRRGPSHAEWRIVYNRRVAYANAVNLLLSVDKVEEARAALSAAALDDPDMAAELRQVAAELPSPMRCSPPRVP
jgi:hypothetical protein